MTSRPPNINKNYYSVVITTLSSSSSSLYHLIIKIPHRKLAIYFIPLVIKNDINDENEWVCVPVCLAKYVKFEIYTMFMASHMKILTTQPI